MKSVGQSEVASNGQQAIAEEINSRISGEGIKFIQAEVKTRNY